MDQFEKVEKLRQSANVTFEEAKEALLASNGDLLDAMIYLEKKGKVDSQSKALPVLAAGEKREEKKQQFKATAKSIWKKLNDVQFVTTKDEATIIKVPVWVLIAVLVLTWWISIILLIVGLFVGCKYSFVGPEDYKELNKVMQGASAFADSIKDKVEENTNSCNCEADF